MAKERVQNKCRGSLAGGAVGDALGYAVEFSSLSEILRKYGRGGITSYETDRDGTAVFSDDTQMTLFTAEGLLSAMSSGKSTEKAILPYLVNAYGDWYLTQSVHPKRMSESWLTHISPLWIRRAPGMSCMSALQTLSEGEGGVVVNNSKGCGGVMRVAPIGIFSAAHPELLSIERAGILAGYAADITHKHPLSTLSSMATAMIVAECIASDKMDCEIFRTTIIERVLKRMEELFPGNKDLIYLRDLVMKALTLAVSDRPDSECICELGEGWVAEETLAIAVFSVMRHIDDFGKCVICSVNHSGDSDSTGAVAGNIIGAILGYEAIPEQFKTELQLQDLIITVADDLAGESSEEQMMRRYIDHLPYNVPDKYLVQE